MRATQAVGLAILAAVFGCTRPPATAPPDAGPPAVTVAAPVVRPVVTYTDLTGTIAAVKTADVRPRVSGYVERVFFKDGAEVKEGDKLVLIDPRPFQATVAKAKAAVENAAATLKLSQASAARTEKARGTGAVSQEEADQARAQVDVAKANVDGAKAELERAELDLSFTTVTAPFDGRVDRIYVTEGNVVTGGTNQGTVLTRIITVDPVFAYFDVDEATVLTYLELIRSRKRKALSEAQVPCEVQRRDETGYPHKGVLEFAGNQLNPLTGSLQIRGTFPNPQTNGVRPLAPGLFVRGRVPLSVNERAVLIPDDAVATDQARKVVYVVGPDDRVEARPVTLGPLSGGLRIVTAGLKPDDRVVIRGLMRVVPGTPVAPQPGAIEVKGTPG